jgi:hypothetical protein
MKPVQDVITAARAVVKAHLDMKRAYADEASDRVKKARQAALREALDKLTSALVGFEKELAAQKAKPKAAGKGFDWSGFFRATVAGVDLLKKARDGRLDPVNNPSSGQEVIEYIDAEVIDVTTKAR